jgi:hypothetical protein
MGKRKHINKKICVGPLCLENKNKVIRTDSILEGPMGYYVLFYIGYSGETSMRND